MARRLFAELEFENKKNAARYHVRLKDNGLFSEKETGPACAKRSNACSMMMPSGLKWVDVGEFVLSRSTHQQNGFLSSSDWRHKRCDG